MEWQFRALYIKTVWTEKQVEFMRQVQPPYGQRLQKPSSKRWRRTHDIL